MRLTAAFATCLMAVMSMAIAEDFTVLEGHGGPVMATAVSTGGGAALTGSFDNSVGLWTLADGSVTWLEGHEAAVKSVIYISETRAASAGDDFRAILWDLTSGDAVAELEGHKGQIQALAASMDGTRLATASWDGSIGLWDADTGANIAFLTGHESSVSDVVFAEGDTALYSTSADGTIRYWPLDRPGPPDIVLRHGFATTELLIDEPAGWLAYGAVDGATRILNLSDLSEIADLTGDRRPVLALAAAPDGSQIAVGDGEGYIMVIATEGWRIVHDFRAAVTGPIWALAYTADGTGVLAGGIDDKAYLWPIGETTEPLFSGETRAFLRDPATMSNGERQFQRKCAVCHSLTVSSQRRAGPTLHGLFGRRAGTVADYSYSDTLDGSDIVWSEETIDGLFDLGPDHYIPGTKMPMQRITAPEDRQDLIAFLRDNT